jgi:6-phosphofructokinase 1
MIVVAEGARAKDGAIRATATASGEYRMGGIAEVVAAEIAARTDREVRVCVLGHLQRGGAPTTLDRILGTRFGIHAVEMIAAGKYGYMVSYQNYLVTEVPIADAVNHLRLVSPEGQMVQASRAVDIEFGD